MLPLATRPGGGGGGSVYQRSAVGWHGLRKESGLANRDGVRTWPPGAGGAQLLKEFPGATGLDDFARWWRALQAGETVEMGPPNSFRRRFVCEHAGDRRTK